MPRGTRRSFLLRRHPSAVPFSLLLILFCLSLGAASCGESRVASQTAGPNGTGPKIPLPDLSPAEPYEVVHEKGIRIVRETDPAQVALYADIFRPADEGRFPVLLEAIAYRREIIALGKVPDPVELAQNGYVVILLDCRGTGSSEGVWGSFSDDEVEDVAWIIDHWVQDQPWSNGKVGLFGPSYMGVIQLLTAARKPAHLKAIFPGVSAADTYRDIFYQGGIFDQEFILFWALATAGLSVMPSTELFRDPFSALKAFVEHAGHIPELFKWLDMTTDQAFFEERSPMTFWDVLAEYPIFMTGGWFCIFTRGSLLNYTHLEQKTRALLSRGPGLTAPKKIVVGPWYHMFGAFVQGLPSEDLHRRWFDWHLKADGDPLYARYDILDPRYPVQLYVMGAEQWRKEETWPLERARYVNLYLSGEQQAADQNKSLNNGTLLWEEERARQGNGANGGAVTRIRHEPPAYAGLESRSTARWIVGVTGFLPSAEDERENEKLTLTFTTAPLERDLEVTGPAVLRFWARTRFQPLTPESRHTLAGLRNTSGADLSRLADQAEQNDVHWIVNLNDVFPEGRSRNLTSGWLAASHRRDPLRPDWTQPGYDPFLYPEDRAPVPPKDGEIYEYVVEIWPTCNLFRAGHQIRIDIVNSDVPHMLPSLVPSESEILHDPEHPSRLILPVVDPASTDDDLWIEDPEAYFQGRVPWDAG